MKNEINPMQRKNYLFLNSPRCGAKTRKGTACQAPAIKSKKRCRMHGGAKGSGAPFGSSNALKHGFTTHEVKLLKKNIKQLLKERVNGS